MKARPGRRILNVHIGADEYAFLKQQALDRDMTVTMCLRFCLQWWMRELAAAEESSSRAAQAKAPNRVVGRESSSRSGNFTPTRWEPQR